MHPHHRRAVLAITVAAVADVAFGIGFGFADHVGVPDGLYFSTVTATTVGYGDIAPRGWLPHLLAVGVMITVIPLWAGAFSLLTSGLASADVRRHVDRRLTEHHRAIVRHMDRRVDGDQP